MKLLIDGGTGALNQIAHIEEDLHNYNYRTGNLSHESMSLEQFTKQLAKNVNNFNAVDENGNTALHIALHRGYIRVANFLHDHGVNINHINNGGNSSLLIAVLEGAKKICRTNRISANFNQYHMLFGRSIEKYNQTNRCRSRRKFGICKWKNCSALRCGK